MSPTPFVRNVIGKRNTVSFTMDFSPSDVIISKRGDYTTVSMSKSAPHGETGEPALPWKKILIAIPENSTVQKLTTRISKQIDLASNVIVDPIQPNIPTTDLSDFKIAQPNQEIYRRAKIWPPELAKFLTVRKIAGKSVAEIIVCPFQYQPVSKKLNLVTELNFVITYDAQPEKKITAPSKAALVYEERSIDRIRNMVVNPANVKSIFDTKYPPLDLFIYPTIPYVIITSAALAASFTNLAQWRTMLGLNGRIVTIEDIQGNKVPDTKNAKFWLTSGYTDGGTRDLAEAIRNFIKWASLHWQTQYVVLGGDTDTIPARKGLILLNTLSYGSLTDTNINKNFISSLSASSSIAGNEADKANDADDTGTFWKCTASDTSPWITANLGGLKPINRVQLIWGSNSASAYKIQISTNNTTWTDVYSTTTGAGGTVDISFTSVSANYVRLFIQSGTNFKLCTMKVFGLPNSRVFSYGPTRSRGYLGGWMSLNPTNSIDLDLMLIVEGAHAGMIVPYNTAANDTTLGWRFIQDMTAATPTVSATPTCYIEICGPATYHGSKFCPKTETNYIPTDLYYADLNPTGGSHHDWDADDNKIYGERYSGEIDSINGIEDVYVGRLSVSTAAQASTIVDKIIHYERYRENSVFEPYLPLDFATSILLAAKNWYDPKNGYLDGAASCNEAIRHMLLSHSSNWDFTRLYEDKNDVPAADVTSDLSDASANAIKSAIAEGNNLVSLVSHGSSGYVCYLVNSDVDDEVDIPSVWYGNACSTNAFDNPTAISEASLRNPVGGSIAYVGNSRYGWTGDGPMEKSFWEEMFDSGILGNMVESAHQTGGDWQKYSINLLGDPAMRVWSGTPRQLVVTYNSEISTGKQNFNISVHYNGFPVADAVVCTSMLNSFCITGVTNAAGTATLKINPQNAGTMYVGVAGKNIIPFIGTVVVKQAITQMVCKVPELCATPLLVCKPKLFSECSLALMCKNFVACSLDIGLVCRADISQLCKIGIGGQCMPAVGVGCPNIDPIDWNKFKIIYENYGYFDLEEFVRDIDTPELAKQINELPSEAQKPLKYMIDQVKKVI
jgi:hypothetical protein